MIIDGKHIAQTIQDNIKKTVAKLSHRKPALAFILVGNQPASRTYIKMKKKRCAEVGITSIDKELPEDTPEADLLAEIYALNHNPQIDGILVQLPLPPQINTSLILEAIDPSKDVDGFHPINTGKLLNGEQDGFIPCTPYGIQVLLSRSNIETQGKHIVILGRSNIVGKPLAALLMQKKEGANATVTVAHSASENLKELCLSADILIAAIGRPQFVTEDMVKPGAVVIDVGINKTSDHGDTRLVGDVDFESLRNKCSHITPVPGGVGPMTIAMLLSNTLLSYQRSQS